MAIQSGGDIFNREQAEALLYPAKGLPGGGQLEVRMEISADHPDPRRPALPLLQGGA